MKTNLAVCFLLAARPAAAAVVSISGANSVPSLPAIVLPAMGDSLPLPASALGGADALAVLPSAAALAPADALLSPAATRLPMTGIARESQKRFRDAIAAVAAVSKGGAFEGLLDKGQALGVAGLASSLGIAFDGSRRYAGEPPAGDAAAPPAQAVFSYEPATEADIPAIDALVKAGSILNQAVDENGYPKTGFVADDGPEFYLEMLRNPHARITVVRDGAREIVAFSMYYSKGAIDPSSPRHEFNTLFRDAVEKAYGPDADFMILKHAVVAPKAEGHGIARKLLMSLGADAKARGMLFVMGTIANDNPLLGTVLESPERKLQLINLKSLAAFGGAKGVVKVNDRWVYSKEVGDYLGSGVYPKLGIHNWEAHALVLDPAKPPPAVAVPEKNRPPAPIR